MCNSFDNDNLIVLWTYNKFKYWAYGKRDLKDAQAKKRVLIDLYTSCKFSFTSCADFFSAILIVWRRKVSSSLYPIGDKYNIYVYNVCNWAHAHTYKHRHKYIHTRTHNLLLFSLIALRVKAHYYCLIHINFFFLWIFRVRL